MIAGREVVWVTGFGIVSALGCGCLPTLDALRLGRSGLGHPQHLRTKHQQTWVGEVASSDAELMQLLGLPSSDSVTRSALMGLYAAREALGKTADGSSGMSEVPGLRVGFINGTTVGGMDRSERHYRAFMADGSHAEAFREHHCGDTTERIMHHLGSFDFCSTISTACSSAANAILMGAQMIEQGRLDRVVVGGTEALSVFHVDGFRSLMILDDEPCRPFDAQRAGINLGEGAAYLVLESGALAAASGHRCLAYLSGWGHACDAHHQTASSPEGKGASLAMQAALDKAGLRPEAIDYINAHGTGTENNDQSEAQALEEVFGHVPPYSSTKSFTGHTTSAAGAIEAVLSLLALQAGFMPASLNFRQPSPACCSQPIKQNMAVESWQHFLNNSFGFGGNSTSLIFSSPQRVISQ